MIEKVIIKNYKGIKSLELSFNRLKTVIVGNNGVGKSTIIEALQLALGDNEYKVDLTQFSFHKSDWEISDRRISNLPKIEIEIYFSKEIDLPDFRGKNNLLLSECSGVRFSFEFDEAYEDIYAKETGHRFIPCEYYHIVRTWFSGQPYKKKLLPFRLFVIDSSNSFFNTRPRQFMSHLLEDDTDDFKAQMLSCLAGMRATFDGNHDVQNLNQVLSTRAQEVKKGLSISIDLTSKNSYSSILTPFVDGIPFENAGLGEQCIVKTLLSLGTPEDSKPRVLFIEEPETHLSHTMMYHLMNLLNTRDNAQLIITTHSSFVANRMDLGNLVVLHKDDNGHILSKRLQIDLGKNNYKYFFKSTDYSTLRIILSKAAILVEGPTDEMVCHYFMRQTNRESFHNGVELMAVGGVSFKHFIALAKDLKIKVAIIRDKDTHNLEYYNKLYFGSEAHDDFRVFIDENNPSIEQSFVNANSNNIQELSDVVRVQKTPQDSREELIAFMANNKTEWAYRLMENEAKLSIPDYIKQAFDWIYDE